MNLFNWITGYFSSHGKAMSLYKRGMAKAKKHDHRGALDDYTTMIGMQGPPTDLLAMVLYNRALVYVAAGDDHRGVADLDAVLAMHESLVNVKAMARQKLARMKSRGARVKRGSVEVVGESQTQGGRDARLKSEVDGANPDRRQRCRDAARD